jgi:hypothetical protein
MGLSVESRNDSMYSVLNFDDFGEPLHQNSKHRKFGVRVLQKQRTFETLLPEEDGAVAEHIQQRLNFPLLKLISCDDDSEEQQHQQPSNKASNCEKLCAPMHSVGGDDGADDHNLLSTRNCVIVVGNASSPSRGSCEETMTVAAAGDDDYGQEEEEEEEEEESVSPRLQRRGRDDGRRQRCRWRKRAVAGKSLKAGGEGDLQKKERQGRAASLASTAAAASSQAAIALSVAGERAAREEQEDTRNEVASKPAPLPFVEKRKRASENEEEKDGKNKGRLQDGDGLRCRREVRAIEKGEDGKTRYNNSCGVVIQKQLEVTNVKVEAVEVAAAVEATAAGTIKTTLIRSASASPIAVAPVGTAIATAAATLGKKGEEEEEEEKDVEQMGQAETPSAAPDQSFGEGKERKKSHMSPGLRVVSAIPGEQEREELMDRLEQSLGYTTCRLPRVLTVAQRRRAGMVKQWSMDETKSWFYARSSSLDRSNKANLDDVSETGPATTATPFPSCATPLSLPLNCAERRRKFFQRKNTSSAPESAESVESSSSAYDVVPFPSAVTGGGVVSRALEEVMRTSTFLNWESCDMDNVPVAVAILPLTEQSTPPTLRPPPPPRHLKKPSNLFLGGERGGSTNSSGILLQNKTILLRLTIA